MIGEWGKWETTLLHFDMEHKVDAHIGQVQRVCHESVRHRLHRDLGAALLVTLTVHCDL